MLRILCDEKMPHAREAFASLGTVATLPVHAIVREAVMETDILLVRSGLRIDASLLDGTPVRYVASATAGTDHVDRAYLAGRGIPFDYAPGCNADSVVEYVFAALFHLAAARGCELEGKTLGIVGCGHVGGRLARRAPALGLHVLCCDPPLAETNGGAGYHAYQDVLGASDILSFHTPLIREGASPTHHLLDAPALGRMKQGAWLINASRGAVVDGRALGEALDQGRLDAVVLDVWEGEPEVDLGLMQRIDIATPHIAGHSYEGKVNGTIQLYEALQRYLGVRGEWDARTILAPGPEDHLALTWPATTRSVEAGLRIVVRSMYNIVADDRAFRDALATQADEQAAFFRRLRRDYPRRRTFGMFSMAAPPTDAPTVRALRDGLGIQLD